MIAIMVRGHVQVHDFKDTYYELQKDLKLPYIEKKIVRSTISGNLNTLTR